MSRAGCLLARPGALGCGLHLPLLRRGRPIETPIKRILDGERMVNSGFNGLQKVGVRRGCDHEQTSLLTLFIILLALVAGVARLARSEEPRTARVACTMVPAGSRTEGGIPRALAVVSLGRRGSGGDSEPVSQWSAKWAACSSAVSGLPGRVIERCQMMLSYKDMSDVVPLSLDYIPCPSVVISCADRQRRITPHTLRSSGLWNGAHRSAGSNQYTSQMEHLT